LPYKALVWADEGLNDPGMFDYNDRFIFEDAGSPFPDHEYHPIQAVYLVDSTCISWCGFNPEGDELSLCQMRRIEDAPIYLCSDGVKYVNYRLSILNNTLPADPDPGRAYL